MKYTLFAILSVSALSVVADLQTVSPQPTFTLSRFAKIDGNMLLIDVPAENAREGAVAVAEIDLSKIDSGNITASIECSGENISKPTHSWNGLKFQFEFDNPVSGEKMYLNTAYRIGTFERRKIYSSIIEIGGKLGKVKLRLGLQDSSGKVRFDLSTLKIGDGMQMYPRENADYRVAYPDRVKNRPQLRGVMLPGGPCKEDDFRTLRDWGATLARYQMIRNWGAEKSDRDIGDYVKWLDGKLDHLDREVLPWAEKYGIMIVVDLHVPPGGRIGGDMAMFYEKEYNDCFIECWRKIARRFKGRKMIYGYDLINEPQQTDYTKFDYWNTQRMAAEAVREIDPDVTIIIESNGWDAAVTFGYLSPLKMDNVIYQLHMYEPFQFTHQGVGEQPKGPVYPDEKKGWNRDFIVKKLSLAREFERKHGAKIYVGEFSAAAWAAGADKLLADAISVFNEYGWDWTYHAFREWPGWSVEHEGEGPNSMRPSKDNPRMRALKAALGGNGK